VGVSEPALSKGGKSQMSVAIAYILVSVVLGATGQILLKKGMGGMGPLTLSVSQLGNILWRIVTNPYVVIGLGIYVCGTLFWLMALSRVDLSYAYPFASLSYIVMLTASWLLFNENITPMRVLGSVVVGIGVLIISRS
jgi:drug/metabolite transporter (DMT)-like permease